MTGKKIKWASHVTQMGGFAIGCMDVYGEPEYISTVPGFEKQDMYFKKYHNKEVKIMKIDDFNFIEKMDLVVMNPPCAGLSRLTSNTTSSERLEYLNDLVISCTKQAILCYDSQIIVGESAEGLSQKNGEVVLNNLKSLSMEYGYTLSLYVTDTQFHGLPQSRKRTFYILKKGKGSLIGKISEKRKDLSYYVYNDSKELNSNLLNDITYKFIKEVKNINPRLAVQTLKSKQKNTFQYILENNLFDELIDFIKDDKEKEKWTKIKNKKNDGGNVILPYPRFWFDIINGITWKNMGRSVHPLYDRSFTIKEVMSLMGFPDNYPEVDISDVSLIGKNVPVNTARTILKRLKFTDGEISGFFIENNIKNQNIENDDW
jgi:site-specific DNA-cytosine methylase